MFSSSIILALLGSLFFASLGSFLGCLSYRLKIAQNSPYKILFKPSHCPTCQKSLRLWELVPLLSTLLLRGQCRHCQNPYPQGYYLLFEGGCLGIFIALFFLIGGKESVVFALFGSLLLAIAVEDWQCGMISPLYLIGLGGISLSSALTIGVPQVPLCFTSTGLALIFVIVLSSGYALLRRQKGIGEGDIYLLAFVSLWIHPYQVPLLFFLASTSTLIGVFLSRKRKTSFTTPFPFAPGISFAAFCITLGERLL